MKLHIFHRKKNIGLKSVMSEYKKNGHEQISEYIRMPHYVPNEYPNVFGCNIFTERISEYIHIPEIARI